MPHILSDWLVHVFIKRTPTFHRHICVMIYYFQRMVCYDLCKNVLSQFEPNLYKVSSAESFDKLAFQRDNNLLIGNNHWDLWWSHGRFISNKVIPSLCTKLFSSSVVCHSFRSVRNSNIFSQYYIKLCIMCFLKAGWRVSKMYRGGLYKSSNEPPRSINLVRLLSLGCNWHKQHIP